MKKLITLCLLFLICACTPTQEDEPLRKKIAQMIIIGFRGVDKIDDHDFYLDVAKYGVGGFILFDRDLELQTQVRNLENKKQIKSLIEKVQAIRSADPYFFIAIDQEGGLVARLNPENGFNSMPTAAEMGRTSATETYAAVSPITKEMANLGINLNLAPVVDIDSTANNGIHDLQRSFSANPKIISDHAIAFIRAHQEKKILNVIKHFPGHGSAKDDSHQGLPDITYSWSEKELIPYRNVLTRYPDTIVMLGHLMHKKYDEQYPASLSKKIVDTLLRGQLGFSGVIMSDDLLMKAITKRYSFQESLISAINAGVDILLLNNNEVYDPKIFSKALELIENAVKSGQIPIDRINKSYKKIVDLKVKYQKKK